MDVRYVASSSQYIHHEVYDRMGTFRFWLTAIYAHNRLDQRRILWKHLTSISTNYQGPWCAVGDFNNFASSNDRVGGRMVT